MDIRHFDRLTRTLGEAGTRRGLLGLLATLPVLGGLFALLDLDELDAKGRRKRRKKAHKHGKGRRRKHHKKCKPDSTAKTCKGKCGPVTNNCKKTVDCGPCDCDPACEECFTCQGESGVPGSCVPQSTGSPCGDAAACENGTLFPQGSCDGSGGCEPGTPVSCDPYLLCDGDACATTCATNDDCVAESFCNADHRCAGDKANGESCDNAGECLSGICVDGVCCDSACNGDCEACNLSGNVGSCTTEEDGTSCGGDNICCTGICQECCHSDECAGATPICDGGICEACGSNAACVNAGKGDLCCGNGCFTGICCNDDACTSEEAPDCVDHDCVCSASNDTACDGGETCCDDGCADLQTDPDNCAACGEACPGDQVCQGGVCGFACGSAFCPAATQICLDGACQSCDVVNGQSLADAITAATAGDTLHICAGTYGKITVDKSLTLIGAGQGSDAASNTILDAAQSGIVVTANTGHTVVLRRLRITGGEAGGGAGIINNGTLSLTDCTVTKNDATGSAGGGIHNRGAGVLNLTNCTVSENKAAVGGGIYQSSAGAGSTTLVNTLVRLNTSTGSGAGIRVNAGALNFNSGSTITENTADDEGGGISNNGTVTCDGSGSIFGNKAANGGGINNQVGGSVTLNGTPVTGNNPNNCTPAGAVAGCVG